MKKNLIKGVFSASVSLLAFGASASNLSDQFDVVPYVGADAQRRSMEFKQDYGKNLTKQNYPQGNVYLGLKLNQYVGLEVGYEFTKTLKKSTTANGTEIRFGQVFFPDIDTINGFDTKTKIRAFHGNIVGFLPISEQYCLQLIGSVGVARAKIKIVHDVPIENNIPNTAFAADHRVFSKSKWIPKIGLGLQHMVTCQLGVRAMAGWEGTNRFKDIKPTNVTSTLVGRTKDSFNFGVGLFYNFK
jgi:hypothetical protein